MTDIDIVERIRNRHDWPGDLADEAADEIERLRAVLQEVAAGTEHPCAYCYDMAQLARRALENKE